MTIISGIRLVDMRHASCGGPCYDSRHDMGKLNHAPSCLPRSLPLLIGLLALQLNAQDAPQFRINTDLVTVPTAVTDRHGIAVSDMKVQEFRLFDDGARTEIEHLWRDTDLTFTVGIIVDI